MGDDMSAEFDSSDLANISSGKRVHRNTAYEFSRPDHVEKVLSDSPIAFLPVGCVEYHGPHLPLGVDMLTADSFCHRTAERTGGLVLPPFWLASGVLPLPHGVFIDLELLRKNIRSILSQLASGGFKVIVVFSGHGALDHLHVLREEADLVTQNFEGVKAFATVWNELNFDLPGDIHDHGAKVETSYMMEFFPESVELTALDDDPNSSHIGVYGPNPRFTATRDWGSQMADHAVNRLVEEIESLLKGKEVDSWRLLRGLVERLQSGDLEVLRGRTYRNESGGLHLYFYNPHPQSKYITGIQSFQIDDKDVDFSSGVLRNESVGEGHTDIEIESLGPLSGFYIRRQQEMLLELPELDLADGEHSVEIEFCLADVFTVKAEGVFTVSEGIKK